MAQDRDLKLRVRPERSSEWKKARMGRRLKDKRRDLSTAGHFADRAFKITSVLVIESPMPTQSRSAVRRAGMTCAIR